MELEEALDEEVSLRDLEQEEIEDLFERLLTKLEAKDDRIRDLEEIVKEKEEEVDELEELAKKIKADFENYKKRVNDEIDKKYLEGKRELVEELLIIVDSFDQAIDLDSEPDEEFLNGVKNIRSLLLDKLESEGLREVGYDEFDSRKHKAIEKVDVDGEERSKSKSESESEEIVEVVQRGYIFKDKVIRPALVKVAK